MSKYTISLPPEKKKALGEFITSLIYFDEINVVRSVDESLFITDSKFFIYSADLPFRELYKSKPYNINQSRVTTEHTIVHNNKPMKLYMRKYGLRFDKIIGRGQAKIVNNMRKIQLKIWLFAFDINDVKYQFIWTERGKEKRNLIDIPLNKTKNRETVTKKICKPLLTPTLTSTANTEHEQYTHHQKYDTCNEYCLQWTLDESQHHLQQLSGTEIKNYRHDEIYWWNGVEFD